MKKLLLLSGKGGAGKTTLSVALIKLSRAGASADCDVDAPNLHLVMGQNTAPQRFDFTGGERARVDAARCTGCGLCEARCRFGAIAVKDGRARVDELACEGCGVCRLVCPADAVELIEDLAGERSLYTGDSVFSTAVLRMGRGNSGKLVSEVKRAMFTAAPACALAIVDGSPGIGCPVIASASGMDMILIAAEPSDSGISDLGRLVETAASFGARLAVCVNRWDVSPRHTSEIERLCAERGLVFAGKIPFDPAAVRAANEGRTVVDIDCPAGRAVREIYRRVSEELGLGAGANSPGDGDGSRP